MPTGCKGRACEGPPHPSIPSPPQQIQQRPGDDLRRAAQVVQHQVLIAALGELVVERSGVLNLGVEGMMVMGAVTGFAGAQIFGDPWAGVALAIHLGGPGALFWMWVTAFLGMATKYSEVTLAQKYREVDAEGGAHKWEGAVSGGPMYYIEKGLGPRWRPMAVFFAAMLAFTAFLTGNAVQANTVADNVQSVWGVPVSHASWACLTLSPHRPPL